MVMGEKMALQKPLKSVTGHENPEAYHTIETIVLTWPQPPTTPVLQVTLKVWKDQTARNEGNEPFESLSFTFPISGDQKEIGSISEIYSMLKKLPEYEGAIDI